ncbi:recombination regulator RecX [Metabacillus herbersteinensis]|uniref:Regulatory protein RecX n=1 Tax=Metabacillus herbersteinensis TaxID=283816 RepID=A0ABV6GJF3_9BACI
MPIITKITAQQRNDDRFNIFLDDGKGERFAFSVDQDVLLKFGLKKGKELDDLDLVEIEYGDDSKKAFNKAIEYLGYRMRSIKEIKDYLRKKEVDSAVIDEVIHKMKEYRYVDDLDFARAYVKTHWQTNGKGPNVLTQELFGKGIDRNTIEEALVQYDQASQIEEAIKHAVKTIKKNKMVSSTQSKQKVEQTLLRKGFPFSVISIALEDLELKKEEPEEWDALIKQAEKAANRYKNEAPYQFKMKMKQYLYRKGFAIELIDRYLEE